MILPIGQMNIPLEPECNDDHAWDDKGECVRCGEYCDHSDIDEHTCLICGADMTEEWACKAYDNYKDSLYDN